MNKSLFLKVWFWLIMLLPVRFCWAQEYTVDRIPNPKTYDGSSVSNPDHILNDEETDSLNRVLNRLEDKTGVQTAIVVIHDFDAAEDDFNFSVALFRKWGIGRARSDNGLLLLVAIDRHRYRFITGNGLEGLLPDADLKTIGEHSLVPAFKQEEYGKGIVNAINIISEYLLKSENKGELADLLAKNDPYKFNWLWPAIWSVLLLGVYLVISRIVKKSKPKATGKPKSTTTTYDWIATAIIIVMVIAFVAFILILAFTIGFARIAHIKPSTIPVILYVAFTLFILLKYLSALSTIRKHHKDDANAFASSWSFVTANCWFVFVSPFILLVILGEAVRKKKLAARFVAPLDEHGNAMVRVDRDQNKTGEPYLSAGQQKEEDIESYIYDIWLNNAAGSFKLVQLRGAKNHVFDNCPQCGFKTLSKPKVITVVKPTYSRQGEGKKMRRCMFCTFEELIRIVSIPMLVKSSSSSSGSSSSSSGSGSSSSGGSYGGGSTSGGGAGGSW